jgi:hypothetical protein
LLLTTAIAVILKLVSDALSAVRADCALFHPFGEALRMEIVSAKRLEVTSVVSANGAHVTSIVFLTDDPFLCLKISIKIIWILLFSINLLQLVRVFRAYRMKNWLWYFWIFIFCLFFDAFLMTLFDL